MVLLYGSKALAFTRIHTPETGLIYLLGGSVWEPDASKRVVPVLLDRTHHLVVEPCRLIQRSDDRDYGWVASIL